MVNIQTKKGLKVRKSFDSPFKETGLQRLAINLLMSKLDYELLTEEEKVIYDEFKNYNSKVENIINN